MYHLPQAGIVAQELLEERLAKHGYRQSKIKNVFGNTKPDQHASPWWLTTLR